MINNSLFKILYKICKKQNVSFEKIDANDTQDIKQQQIISILTKIHKQHLLNAFIEFCNYMEEKNKNILFLPFGRTINNDYIIKTIQTEENFKILNENIYDGFMYLDKNKYVLYDHSLKTRIKKFKETYLERILNE